jgi:hypothetical protein
MPADRHRGLAGMGLVVGPGNRRQPSRCGISTATGLAHLSSRRIIQRYGAHHSDRDDRPT